MAASVTTKSFWSSIYLLQQQNVLCDVQLYVKGSDDSYDIIPTHKVVLVGSSEYFYSSLLENGELLDVYHFDGISRENLQVVVDYLYRQITWEQLSENVEAISAAQTLQILSHELTDSPPGGSDRGGQSAQCRPKVMIVKVAKESSGSGDVLIEVNEDAKRENAVPRKGSKTIKQTSRCKSIQTDPVLHSDTNMQHPDELSALNQEEPSQKMQLATELVALSMSKEVGHVSKEVEINKESIHNCKDKTIHSDMVVVEKVKTVKLPEALFPSRENKIGQQYEALNSISEIEALNISSKKKHKAEKGTTNLQPKKLYSTKEENVNLQQRLENKISDTVVSQTIPTGNIRRSSRTPKPSRLWKEMDRPLLKKSYSPVQDEAQENQDIVETIVTSVNDKTEINIINQDTDKNEEDNDKILIQRVDKPDKIEFIEIKNQISGLNEEEIQDENRVNRVIKEEIEEKDIDEEDEIQEKIFLEEEDTLLGTSGVDMNADHRKVRKSVPCKVCNKVLNSVAGLILHERKIHNIVREFECQKCGENFKTNRLLQIHLSKVHNILKFSCDECGSKFKTREGWRYHFQKMHSTTATPDHICDLCGKRFLKGHQLTSHIKFRHSDNRPFECDQCNRAFKNKQMLKRHVNTFHSLVRKHMCDICGTMFKTHNDMKKHREKHFREGGMGEQGRVKKYPDGQKYPCQFCSKIFTKRNHQLAHENMQHRQRSQGVSFLCTLCNKSFPIKHYLMQHIKHRHMPKRYRCSTCNSEFCQKADLAKHIATPGRCKGLLLVNKPFQCSTCNKGFTLKGNLTKHLQQPGRCKGNVDMMSDVIVVLQQQEGEQGVDAPYGQQVIKEALQVAQDQTTTHPPTSVTMSVAVELSEQELVDALIDEVPPDGTTAQEHQVSEPQVLTQYDNQIQEDGTENIEIQQVDIQELQAVEIHEEVHMEEGDLAQAVEEVELGYATDIEQAVGLQVDSTPIQLVMKRGEGGEMIYTVDSQEALDALRAQGVIFDQ